jgi:lysozyme
MTTSQRGKALIKQFEGLKLNAYLCSANVPTIGYGNTYYPNGVKVKLGDKISQEQAEELLKDILKKFEAIVNRKLKVKVIRINSMLWLVTPIIQAAQIRCLD